MASQASNRAVVIKASNLVKFIEFEPDEEEQTIRNVVGGHFEYISLKNRIDMWVNANARCINLPLNAIATDIYKTIYKHGRIYGDVILTSIDEHNDTIGLSDTQINYVDTFVKKTLADL